MKITVEFSEIELRDIRRFTGEGKKGPAVRKMVMDALMLKKREEIARRFITGNFGAELAGFEESRAADRKAAKKQSGRWRGNAAAD
jgi:hypothetical protein